jgi:FtsZ-binding cell division protein ZapB
MISVEQVRALEERVEKAVAFIAALKHENSELREELDVARQELAKALSRASELEAAAEAYRRDQASIEEGIVHALRKLDAFEDLVLKAGEARTRPEPEALPQREEPRAAERGFAIKEKAEAKPAAAPQPRPEPQAKPAPAPQAAGRDIEELSLEELEAATAPEAPAKAEAPAAPAAPQAAPAPVENELDIF